MGRKPKDAIAFARLHCTPTKGVCQHLAQKIFFCFGQVDKCSQKEYNTHDEQRRSSEVFFASVNAFAHFLF